MRIAVPPSLNKTINGLSLVCMPSTLASNKVSANLPLLLRYSAEHQLLLLYRICLKRILVSRLAIIIIEVCIIVERHCQQSAAALSRFMAQIFSPQKISP